LRSVSAGGKDRGFVIAPESSNGSGKPVSTLLNEFVSLVVAYAREQTVDPIRSLGRYLVFGLAGAFMVSIGGGLAVLATVRLIQAETDSHLTGSLTWAPYTGGFIVALVGAGLAAYRIRRGLAKTEQTGAKRGPR
jgi:hypothetical protein